MHRPPFETLGHIDDPRRHSTSHRGFIASLRAAKPPTTKCHMSRLSIRSLKSSTVSTAEIFDQIQKSLKWSLVPLCGACRDGLCLVRDTCIRWRILPQGCDVAGGVLQFKYSQAMSVDFVGPRRRLLPRSPAAVRRPVRLCAACASREADSASSSRPQLMSASNAEPD